MMLLSVNKYMFIKNEGLYEKKNCFAFIWEQIKFREEIIKELARKGRKNVDEEKHFIRREKRI